MKNLIPHLIISAALTIVSASLVGQTPTTISSGDWSDGAIWTTPNPPTGGFIVSSGHEVTAGAGVSTSSTSRQVILGTLNLNTGSSLVGGGINFQSPSEGTLNVNGGHFKAVRFEANAEPAPGNDPFTINLNSGSVELTGSGQAAGTLTHNRSYIINLNGGEFRYNHSTFYTHDGENSSRAIHLNAGGHLILSNGIGSTLPLTAGGSWTGGTLTTNTASISGSDVNTLFTGEAASWSTHPDNVIALSSNASAQTLTVGNNVNANQGILAFRIYSANQNDNDQFIMDGANELTLESGVLLRIEGFDLAGNPEDYWGQTYQLFTANDYTSINPTVQSTTLNIDGFTHNVSWTPQGDGSYMLIPEPGTYAMMFGALALGLVILRRRFS